MRDVRWVDREHFPIGFWSRFFQKTIHEVGGLGDPPQEDLAIPAYRSDRRV
jgi:hypothetical protein